MRTFLIATFALLANIALTPLARSEPFEKLPDDLLRHTISGFLFPSSVDVFRRGTTNQYNQEGSDVSAGYYADAPVAATVYVYPAPAAESAEVLKQEYESKRSEVLHGHADSELLSETSTSVTQGDKKQTGQRAYFTFRGTFAGTPQDLKSQLFVFQDGLLFIEYRFTYPKDKAEKAEAQIESFMTAWSWRPPSSPAPANNK